MIIIRSILLLDFLSAFTRSLRIHWKFLIVIKFINFIQVSLNPPYSLNSMNIWYFDIFNILICNLNGNGIKFLKQYPIYRKLNFLMKDYQTWSNWPVSLVNKLKNIKNYNNLMSIFFCLKSGWLAANVNSFL